MISATHARKSIPVVILVLSATAYADAESGWVLWSSWQGGQYTVSSTHEDRVGCVRAIDRNLIRWVAGNSLTARPQESTSLA